MNVFLSHADGDAPLARRIAEGLRGKGLAVWLAEEEVFPGDNWARRVSQALDECDAMVALFTQNTPDSGSVQRDVGYALCNKAYRRRVIPVLVGREDQLSSQAVPWVLDRAQVRLVEPDQTEQTVQQIAETLTAATAEREPSDLERTLSKT